MKISISLEHFQKNPRVRKIRVRNSGAGNGSANLWTPRKNALSLQEKPMSIKILLLGGGGILGSWGGGSADFIFLGARFFLTFQSQRAILNLFNLWAIRALFV